MARQKTFPTKIKEKLETLKINESFCKKEFITQHWGDYDFFLDRTFSVAFVNAKKEIFGKKFKTIKKQITRIK